MVQAHVLRHSYRALAHARANVYAPARLYVPMLAATPPRWGTRWEVVRLPKLVQACPVKEFTNQPEPSWLNKLLTGELVQACLVKHVFEPLVSQPICRPSQPLNHSPTTVFEQLGSGWSSKSLTQQLRASFLKTKMFHPASLYIVVIIITIVV